MKRNTFYRIFISFCLLFMAGISAHAYTERNLLQKAAGSEEQLKEALVMNQKWVPYPAYNDRAGWDELLGTNKESLIRAGEKMLNYEWKVIRATDYLEYERSGERNIMQNPYEANRKAINTLMLAELAEGKGRFIDQLINGAFYSCEMTSWVLSAHLVRQSTKRSLPDYREQVIDLGSGNFGSMLSWVYYFFHDSFDKIDPVISQRLRHTLQKRILDPYMNNKSGWFLATKGGFNNESHNHNDVGTFSLYVNTIPVLIDAGVGTYTRQTFSSERYTIWTMQSNYHNLPMINGVPQSFGQNYKATDVVCQPKKRFFSANIATAYPKEAEVNSWTRAYSLGDKQLTITDNFSLKSTKEPNQVNFLTWGKVDISVPGKVTIDVQGQRVTLEYPGEFTATVETINLPDTRLSNVWGTEIYRIALKDKDARLTGKYKFVIK